MTHRTSTPADPTPKRRRRRTPRPLTLLAALPEQRTAEARDDEHAAEELMNDLLALVQAGVIAPVSREGAVRYAPADPDSPAA